MRTRLSTRALERIVRGFSCHRRIQILLLIINAKEPLSLRDISHACRVDFRTAAEHTRRLDLAGLIEKRKRGREVLHESCPLGYQVARFLGSL